MNIPAAFECSDMQRDTIYDWVLEKQMNDEINVGGHYLNRLVGNYCNWASLINYMRSLEPRATQAQLCKQLEIKQANLSSILKNSRFEEIHKLLFPTEEVPLKKLRKRKTKEEKIVELKQSIERLEGRKYEEPVGNREETLKSLEEEAKKAPKPVPEWARRIYESVGNKIERDKLLKEKSFEEKQKENKEMRETIKEVTKRNPEIS